MSSAAGQRLQLVTLRFWGRGAKIRHIADQRLVSKDLLQCRAIHVQIQNGAVAIHLWSDRGVERAGDAYLRGQSPDSGIILAILGHQNVGDDDLQSVGLEESDGV